MTSDALIYLQHPIEGRCPRYFWRCEIKPITLEGQTIEALFFTDGSCALTLECGKSFVHVGIKSRTHYSEVLGCQVLVVLQAKREFLELFDYQAWGACMCYAYCQPRECQRFTILSVDRNYRVTHELLTFDDPDPLEIQSGTDLKAVVLIVLGVVGAAWAVCLLQGGRPW